MERPAFRPGQEEPDGLFPPLRRDGRVALGVDDTEHVGEGIGRALHHHGEDAGGAAGDQRDALLVHGDGLLPGAAGHVPEHHVRQLVAVLCEQLLRVLEVREGSAAGAAVKLHVGDDVEGGGQVLLRHAVFRISSNTFWMSVLAHSL